MEDTSITHLTFDFFGTLVGYTHGHFQKHISYRTSHAYLLEVGLSIDYETYLLEYSQIFDLLQERSKSIEKEFHMNEATRLLFFKHERKVSEKTIETFTKLYSDEWNNGIILYPEMNSFLKKLNKKYRLSIISNTHYPSLIHRNLEAMVVSQYFDVVMTSVEYGIPKPNKNIFLETLKKLSVSPEHVIHIGDSYNSDYLGSKNAGINSILLDPSRAYEGTVVERVDTIFDIASLLNA